MTSSLSGNTLYFRFIDNAVCVGIMYSSLFEFSELNLLSAFILCFGKSPSIIVLGHAPPVFSHFFSLFTKCLHGRPLLQSFVVFIFSFRFYTKRENKIRAQKTGTSSGVFLNQNMCCASAPGYLAALIHHAVNSAAPSARAIFRTLAPSRRGCLRTARHLGSFSCRSSITFENLFVNVAYVHQRYLRIMYATYHFFAMQCRRGRIKRRDREYRKCNAFG